jgi:hypothetical protein
MERAGHFNQRLSSLLSAHTYYPHWFVLYQYVFTALRLLTRTETKRGDGMHTLLLYCIELVTTKHRLLSCYTQELLTTRC